MSAKLSRRRFLQTATCAAPALLHRPAWPQPAGTGVTTHPDIAAIDHLRILVAADRALAHPPAADRSIEGPGWLGLTLAVPALAAACIVRPAQAPAYSAAAAAMLKTWLLTPATKPVLALTSYKQLVHLAPLAETLVALPFLTLDDALLASLKHACAGLLTFLTTDTTALLARDSKDHHQSAWLLTVSALGRLTAADPVLADARHRVRTQFIRAQINAQGSFQHEITGDYPYRDSLWNLDLLAGAAQLLSTRFESLWPFELQDGPGLRSAIAFHAPYIANRLSWPYRADLDHFNDLPCRRPALVFAGHAFAQPDYITLWQTLPADPQPPEILRTFPIRQPLLWLPQTHSHI